MNNFIFTSESVSEGHPDKVCDQISDALLDTYLKADPLSRTAIETVVTPNHVYVFGEVMGPSTVTRKQLEEVIRNRICEIGYEEPTFDWRTVHIEMDLKTQSPEIAKGIDEKEGAGDQGIMFGYAAAENEAYMPSPLYYAQTFLHHLVQARKNGDLPQLGPDGKCQFSIQYRDHKPVGVTAIVASCQHLDEVSLEEVRESIRPYIEKVLPDEWLCPEESFLVNPTGRFVLGGPASDTGLTGRKIIVDTYGGMAPHGGGAFSGKDATKVDRSGAYMARYMAKNVVASGLAKRCTLQLSYAIGKKYPVSFYINTHGTGLLSEEKLVKTLCNLVDLTPKGIRERLGLTRPIFARTAAYGHFGRKPDADGGFSWEKLDLMDDLKASLL